MEKRIRIASIIILVFSLLFLIPLSMGFMFGIAGSDALNFWLMIFGYWCLIVFSFISIFKYKFFVGIPFSLVIFFMGMFLDYRFWKSHNSQFCSELRNNPTCIEDACGFNCTDVGDGIGASVPGTICSDKDVRLCK